MNVIREMTERVTRACAELAPDVGSEVQRATADLIMGALLDGAWLMPADEDRPATFVLRRLNDVTGLSGVGDVAWGVRFPDGPCVIRWCVSEVRQTAVFASLEDVKAVHGHDGKTQVVWL